MGIARKENHVDDGGLDHKGTIDSLQHIYDQFQMIDHVLSLQVDHAILASFQQHNQRVNLVMKDKNRLIVTRNKQ